MIDHIYLFIYVYNDKKLVQIHVNGFRTKYCSTDEQPKQQSSVSYLANIKREFIMDVIVQLLCSPGRNMRNTMYTRAPALPQTRHAHVKSLLHFIF